MTGYENLNSDLEKKKIARQAKNEIVYGMLNIMAESLNDKRLSLVPKLDKVTDKIQELVLSDIDNKNTIMNNEIVELVEGFCTKFDDIVRTYDKEV